MKTVLTPAVALLVFGAILSPSAVAQPVMMDEPSAAVKACVTKNAADVDNAVMSLNDAADFLLQKICAGELAEQAAIWSEEQRRKEAEAYRAQMKAMCEARASRKPASSDKSPFPGDFMGSICENSDEELVFSMRGSAEIFWTSGFVSAPKATAFAAQTLLQVRTKRTNARQ